MPKIICQLENASSEINGIKFVPHGDSKHLISEADVGEPHLSIFLSIPGYVAEGDEQEIDDDGDEEPKKSPEAAPKPETAAQRKARLKAEQEAAEAAAKAAAEKEAAEKAEADRLAAEAAEKEAEGAGETGNDGDSEEKGDEVF